MRVRYAIRWTRLTEVVAMAASAAGLIAVISGLL